MNQTIIYLCRNSSFTTFKLLYKEQQCRNDVPRLHCSSRTENKLIGEHVSQEAETGKHLLWKKNNENVKKTQPTSSHPIFCAMLCQECQYYVFCWRRQYGWQMPAVLVGQRRAAPGSCRRHRRARWLPDSRAPLLGWRCWEAPLTRLVFLHQDKINNQKQRLFIILHIAFTSLFWNTLYFNYHLWEQGHFVLVPFVQNSKLCWY